MFNVIFSGLKTESIRRLPYLGYSLLYLFLLILCIGLLLVFGILFEKVIGLTWVIILAIPFAFLPVLLSFYVCFVLGVKRLRSMGSDRPYLWSVLCLILDMILPLPVAFIALCVVPEGWLLDFRLKEDAKKTKTDLITKNT